MCVCSMYPNIILIYMSYTLITMKNIVSFSLIPSITNHSRFTWIQSFSANGTLLLKKSKFIIVKVQVIHTNKPNLIIYMNCKFNCIGILTALKTNNNSSFINNASSSLFG